MSRTSDTLAAISVALLLLLVHRDGTTACIGAEPDKTRKSRSTAPTRNEHYVKHTFKAKDGSAIDYWVMSPAKIEEGRKYPLVLALHGRGGNTVAATELGSDALREEFPCFVMAPASAADGHWTRPTGFGKTRKKGRNILGDRYETHAPLPLEIVKAATRFVDVFSFQAFKRPVEDMIKWHEATGKPVLMADGAARRETIKDESGKYRDGAYSTVDGKWYADVVADLLKNPGAIGAHLCGAYIRNRYRGRGLIDEMEQTFIESRKLK